MQWMVVPGYSGYEVSDTGLLRGGKNGRGKRLTKNAGGYMVASVKHDSGRWRVCYLHQLVLLAFVGDCPDGAQTAHVDGDPTNNNLANLAYVSPSENQLHRRLHGRANSGPSCWKLNEDKVKEMRNLYESGGISQKALAEMFGVTQVLVSKVIRRMAWKHVA